MAFKELDPATFEVCLTCGSLRGGAPREHRCRCLPRTAQWGQQWQGRDIAGDLALCVLCGRGTVTTWSKWSWLACDLCREVCRIVGERYGHRSALPLGRHSLMNGGVLPAVAMAATTTAAPAGEIAGALMVAVRRPNSLSDWGMREFARLAAALSATRETISLPAWQRLQPPSLGASVDAVDRYGVVPVPADLTTLREAQAGFLLSQR